MQLEAPEESEYVPTGQDIQADKAVDPVFGLYVPAGHFVQIDDPVAS